MKSIVIGLILLTSFVFAADKSGKTEKKEDARTPASTNISPVYITESEVRVFSFSRKNSNYETEDCYFTESNRVGGHPSNVSGVTCYK